MIGIPYGEKVMTIC